MMERRHPGTHPPSGHCHAAPETAPGSPKLPSQRGLKQRQQEGGHTSGLCRLDPSSFHHTGMQSLGPSGAGLGKQRWQLPINSEKGRSRRLHGVRLERLLTARQPASCLSQLDKDLEQSQPFPCSPVPSDQGPQPPGLWF